MAKSKTDRAASAGGSFLGGLANNPAIVIIALVLGGLFIFRDKISEGLGGLGEGLLNIDLPDIKFPDFNFPDFKFPEFEFPEIKFPDFEFPDFSNIFSGFQEQLDLLFSNQASILAGQTVQGQGEDQLIDIPEDTIVNPDGTVSSTTPPTSTGAGATIEELAFGQARAQAFDTIFDLNLQNFTGQQIQQAISNIAFGDLSALAALVVSLQSLAADQQQPTNQGLDNMGIGFDVPFNDPTNLAGGGSFIGGTTTFGDQTNIIDTLSEVLGIFPNLTASQAANALFANPDLTANQFAQITPIQPSISSAGGDPEQIFNNTSDPSLSGLTPEQIFQKLFGNITNF